MNKLIPVALVMGGLVGCGIAPQMPPVARAQVTVATPKCTTQKGCEAMWIDAQEHIQILTLMRLRLSTSDRLETFASRSPPYMTGTVSKYPAGDDAYEIRAVLECRNASTCGDLPARGVNLFNTELANAATMREMASARKK